MYKQYWTNIGRDGDKLMEDKFITGYMSHGYVLKYVEVVPASNINPHNMALSST